MAFLISLMHWERLFSVTAMPGQTVSSNSSLVTQRVGVGDQMLQNRERLRPQRDIFTILAAQETGVEIQLDTV
jgi:hypothetical protein